MEKQWGVKIVQGTKETEFYFDTKEDSTRFIKEHDHPPYDIVRKEKLEQCQLL